MTILAFNILASPFVTLGVSPRDNRGIISDAYERALADSLTDETVLLRAQQILMAPKTRLAAELAWPMGIAPSRVQKILESPKLDSQTLKDMPPLAAANLAAHYLNQSRDNSLYDFILDFQAGHSTAEIVDLINSEHNASGFPLVEAGLVDASLRELTSLHAEALIQSITSLAQPGEELAKIIQARLSGKGPILDFLEQLAERFSTWSASELHTQDKLLNTHFDTIKETPDLYETLSGNIKNAFYIWGEVSAPRQIILGHRHIHDGKTAALSEAVRRLGLYLNNDLDRPEIALGISEAALLAFRWSPVYSKALEADVLKLRENAEIAKYKPALEPLRAVIDTVSGQRQSLIRSLRKNFKVNGKGPAGELFRSFMTAAFKIAESDHCDIAFMLMRSLAVDLHNDQKASVEALIILNGICNIENLEVPPDVTFKLVDDKRIIQNVLDQKALSVAIKNKRASQAIALAGKLSTTADAGDQAGWLELKNQLISARRKSGTNSIIGYMVTFGIIAAIAALSDGNHKQTPGTSTAPATYQASNMNKPVSGIQKPPSGGTAIFTQPELRYCLYQGEIIDALRTLAGDAPSDRVVDHFNATLKDFKSRCGTGQYRVTDEDVVQKQVQANKAQLDREATAIYDGWIGPGLAKPSAPFR